MKALSDFADSGSLPPILMDPFLQWLAQLAGVQYLDTDGIQHISNSVLQRAVATEAVKTDFKKYIPWMKHVVMLGSAFSTTLATNSWSPASDALSEKLKSLSLPFHLLVLNSQKSAMVAITGERVSRLRHSAMLNPGCLW